MTDVRAWRVELQIALTCLIALCSGVRAAAPPAANIACSPTAPSAFSGDAVDLRVWVSPSGAGLDEPQTYAWRVGAGNVEGSGPSVRWNLSAVPEGMQTATVRVQGTHGDTAECSLAVFVELSDRGGDVPGRESGRVMLVRGQPERKGYGLYSYLLLGSPPSPGTRERYAAVLAAYWSILPAVRDLESVLPRNTLNTTYVPVDVAPDGDADAAWALDHYDYARARALLRTLPGDHRDGPYIVSTRLPVVPINAIPVPYLYQDLTAVPPELAAAWIKAFLNQAAQERFAENRWADSLPLRIRTVMAVTSKGIAPVEKALDSLIAIVSKPS